MSMESPSEWRSNISKHFQRRRAVVAGIGMCALILLFMIQIRSSSTKPSDGMVLRDNSGKHDTCSYAHSMKEDFCYKPENKHSPRACLCSALAKENWINYVSGVLLEF